MPFIIAFVCIAAPHKACMTDHGQAPCGGNPGGPGINPTILAMIANIPQGKNTNDKNKQVNEPSTNAFFCCSKFFRHGVNLKFPVAKINTMSGFQNGKSIFSF
jgi:hypothetical protein